MDFFDDDATGRIPAEPSPSSSRSGRSRQDRRPDRRRTRIQRIVILALILFVIVFAIALWARSCAHSRKVESYRTYYDGVATVINDSNSLGKQLNKIVTNPTKLSRKQLIAKLQYLSDQQSEIAVRTDRLEPPGTLTAEQDHLATGMHVRAKGFSLLRSAMLGALGKASVGAQRIASLEAYFSGPDAYYMDLCYMQARQVMSDQGVTDVAVPTSTYYLTSTMFDPARLQDMLNRVGSSSKLAGIHGVGLAGVTAVTSSGEITLSPGKVANIPATADLAFNVRVQNQGDVAESNVPVTLSLKLPDGTVQKQSGSIAAITAGQTQSVKISGFAIPSEALSKESTLTVMAGPVPEERVLSNNKGTFKFILQLKP